MTELTTRQMAEQLNITPDAVAYYVKYGIISPTRSTWSNGKGWIFTLKDLEIVRTYRKFAKRGRINAIKLLIQKDTNG